MNTNFDSPQFFQACFLGILHSKQNLDMSFPHLKTSTTLNVYMAGQRLLSWAHSSTLSLCVPVSRRALHFSCSHRTWGDIKCPTSSAADRNLPSNPLLSLFLSLCWVDADIQGVEDGRIGFSLSPVNCAEQKIGHQPRLNRNTQLLEWNNLYKWTAAY